MSLERIIAEGLLAERPKIIRAECMTCGRPVDAQKATQGGRNRFCSQRCVEYLDNGWFFDGTNGRPSSVPTSDHTDAKSASLARKSESLKAAWRVKRKAALAESWKKVRAKRAAEAENPELSSPQDQTTTAADAAADHAAQIEA